MWGSQHPYKESSSNTLKLPEVSSEEFFQAFGCLENNTFITEENVLEAATIGDLFEMPKLLDDCDRFLSAQFSNLELNEGNLDSVVSLISNIKINSLNESKEILIAYIESYLKSILKQNDETKIEKIREALKQIPWIPLSLQLDSDNKLELLIELTIKHLKLKDVTDEGLQRLTIFFPSVVSLDLTYCDRITNRGLGELNELKNLAYLCLSCTDQITNKGLGQLNDLTNLTFLDLSYCKNISEKKIKKLKGFKNLKFLNLSGLRHIKAHGLTLLKELQNLNYLNLSHCFFSDEGLTLLKESQNLTYLNLYACDQISDFGLSDLKALKNLQFLSLAWCDQIGDQGLFELQELTNLTTFDLAYCLRIGDRGISALTELQNLNFLDLSGLKITDKGLRALKELKNLKELNLYNCSQITHSRTIEEF